MRNLSVITLLILSCGPKKLPARLVDQPYQTYGGAEVVAIGTTASGGSVSTSDFNGTCVDVADNSCIAATRTGTYCDGVTSGPADVIVVNGKAVQTVCYPSPANSTKPVVVSDPTQVTTVLKTANGTAITFDPSTDGKEIQGPLTIDANDVSIYGNGPDKTIINGDVILAKNNARLRGVRIKGNLIITFNDTSVVLCEIDGNVQSEKNNLLFASNTVFGNVQLSGNGDQLYYNKVQGDFTAKGTCDLNQSFADANHDFVVQAAEIGAALVCQ